MDSNLIAALISGAITAIGLTLAYLQWRRDVQIKIEHLRDEVTTELIQQRIQPYSDFFAKLEPLSSVYQKEIRENPSIAVNFEKIFQEAIYGPVGLLASSDTHQLMTYARWGCKLYAEGKISYEAWQKRIWTVHLTIRSDLGIIQPNWPSEIERVRKQIAADSSQSIEQRVESIKHLTHDSGPSHISKAE